MEIYLKTIKNEKMANNITPPIPRSELVEFTIPSTSQSVFNFPQNLENIERGKVFGIDAFNVADIPLTPSGSAVVNATVFNKAYLILAVDNEERITRFPLFLLRPTSGIRDQQIFDGFKINFTKSKIVIPNTTGLVAGESFLFQFKFREA